MAFLQRLTLLALVIATVESARDELKVPVRTVSEFEKAAQSLVAQLLKERGVNAIATHDNGALQWVPASSLEAKEGDTPQHEAELAMRKEFEDTLGAESKDLIGVFERDLQSIKQALQPLVVTIPKNEYGELGHTAVRYALHRLFVARHGWYIQGIDPEGDSFDKASPTEALKGLVPTSVQLLIEKLLYGRGFGLGEVAVLAAMLENVIHQEAIRRTKVVFNAFDMAIDKAISSQDVDFAIEHYMAAYIMGSDVNKMSKEQMKVNLQGMNFAYPGWEATRVFIKKVRAEMYGEKDLTFQQLSMMVIQLGDKHGNFQQGECLELKQRLIGLEEQKDGCVPVSHFYKSWALKGQWQFSETPGYLKELGALDDSDKENPRVMIPNYLDGISNCVASSTYYSVCCINEGEEILGRIEKHFQAPDASPDDLVRFVSNLPSSTVAAGRTLPASLITYLGKIADIHAGRVPLHSRLFLQWMHNAYPHEVPYPHVFGTTHPRLPEIFETEEHKNSTLSRKQAYLMVKADTEGLHKQGACGQWLSHEELYVPWYSRPLQQEVVRRLQEMTEADFFRSNPGMAMIAGSGMILMAVQVVRTVRAFGTTAKVDGELLA